jgi:hypothetical protein
MPTKINTTPNQKLTVSGGSLIISDTSAKTGLVVTSIIAREDTVVSVCTGLDAAGNAYNFKTTLNWLNLKSGDMLIVPDGYQVNAITLTSGSIIANQF